MFPRSCHFLEVSKLTAALDILYEELNPLGYNKTSLKIKVPTKRRLTSNTIDGRRLKAL
jgi:hypothetical protein